MIAVIISATTGRMRRTMGNPDYDQAAWERIG